MSMCSFLRLSRFFFHAQWKIALLAEGGGVDDAASVGRAEVSPEVSLESKGPPGFSCILEMLN